ncbi:MAG: xanthine dehydrogenase family protein subunit M [Bacillota bacterium]
MNAQNQTNTRLLLPEFEYLRPETKAEALHFLDQHRDKNVHILAGGTDLIVKMKTGALSPRYLVNVKDIKELSGVRQINGALHIGAVTTLAALLRLPAIRSGYSALYEALRSMAAPAVRNMATVGGNLCNGSPAADTAPALMVLGTVCTLSSVAGERRLKLCDFFLGPGRTALLPGEMLTELLVDGVRPDSGSSFLKIGRVSADIAKVNIAVYLERDGDRVADCRVAVGSVAPTPLLLDSVVSFLKGSTMSRQVLSEAGRMVEDAIAPITDARSTAEYRKAISRILAEEAMQAAWVRSGGEVPR